MEPNISSKSKKRGRPAQDKATRAYTLDSEVVAFIDTLPEGQRSKFVNEAIREKIASTS